MLSSVGAILAALLMLATDWYLVDPILSAGIGLLILHSSWTLLAETVDILMEATPRHIDMTELRSAVTSVEGVDDIHNVHIRTVTSDLVAMSAHVEVSDMHRWPAVVQATSALLRDRFGIAHATLQPEEPHAAVDVFRGCALDASQDRKACRVMAFPPARHRSDHGHEH